MEKAKETRGRKPKGKDIKGYSFRFPAKLIHDIDVICETNTLAKNRTDLIERILKSFVKKNKPS